MGCHFLLQGIFSTQELNLCLLCLLHCRQILYHWATGEVMKKTWLSTYLYSEERYQKLGKSFSKQKNLRGKKRDKTRVFISGSSPRMTNTYSAGTYYQELPGLISVPFSAEPRGLLHGSITVNNQSQREKWNSFASPEAVMRHNDHCLPPRSPTFCPTFKYLNSPLSASRLKQSSE